MPNKHLIFIVHGMGVNGANWSDSVQKTLTDLYTAYPTLSFVPFDQQFQFVPVTYDSEFEKLRDRWRKTSTLGTALAAAGLAAGLILVHGPIFNCLVDQEALNADAIETAQKQFATHTPLGQFGDCTATYV
jgi:hypothetical protein